MGSRSCRPRRARRPGDSQVPSAPITSGVSQVLSIQAGVSRPGAERAEQVVPGQVLPDDVLGVDELEF